MRSLRNIRSYLVERVFPARDMRPGKARVRNLRDPRGALADRYIRGTGIEFGALHAALSVSDDVIVKYADFQSIELLQKTYRDLADIRAPDIVSDLESMQGVNDDSQDFVIANHVLEHVEDPLRALKSISRVLHSGGVAYLALPEKRFTFDRDRQITPLDHLIKDHADGPDWSLLSHYQEWCRCVDGLDGAQCAQKVEIMLRGRANIHFHVWDYGAMCELFSYVHKNPEFVLEIEASLLNGSEVVWVLRKRTALNGAKVEEERGAPVAVEVARRSNEPLVQERPVEPRPPQEGAACPLCGSIHNKIARPAVGATPSACVCDDCGMVFIWPRVEQDFSRLPEAVYYGDWQLLDLDVVTGLYADVIAARRHVGGVSRMADWRPSVLDVGCGAGHVLPHFRAHGWEVQGVDPWAAVAEIGRKYYRLPIETARIEHATAFAPGKQDLVLSLDVLQFIADPAAHLAACHAAVRPGGMLYLTVPNYGSAESGRESWNWRLFLPNSYINYFTAETLTQLIERAGFTRAEVTVFGGPEGDTFLRATARRVAQSNLTWADLGEEVDDNVTLPPLDRSDVDTAVLSADQLFWHEHGYLILPSFIPDALIDRYCAVRKTVRNPLGWTDPQPYLRIAEIRDICLHAPLMGKLEHILGETMALHLNLTGWVSTERDWHQDDYLNPPTVNSHYAAVWFALDDIQSDSGPFEFVPGSHRWPFIRQVNVLSLLGGMDPLDEVWPWHSERLLSPFFEAEIDHRELPVERFLGRRGDVLIWHSRLVHRGSLARRPGAERRALIAHYSGADRRPDMGETRRHGTGGLYFLLKHDTPEAAPFMSPAILSIRRRIATLLRH
jgi:SAM-dependent methyltransferase